ncbi:MAG TPA: hypothetical protein VGS19_28365 [Streptosporangiaceae bacterium]|nr:hypothetical protein [Streptosporangiaceae bacterium]
MLVAQGRMVADSRTQWSGWPWRLDESGVLKEMCRMDGREPAVTADWASFTAP